jgi:hypothetical protein
MPTWLTDLLPYAGPLVTLFIGLIGWRIQLIGKRRTELAEEALLVFAKAVDAMASIRVPMSLAGERHALRKELGKPEDKKLPGEAYRITLWRLDKWNDRFAELRRVQLLCRYHFGEAAHDAFEQLHNARHRVAVAAHMGADCDALPAQPETITLLREWQATIWAGVVQPDAIADAVSAAQRDLEAILKPHLRADAALLPIAALWQAPIGRRKARRDEVSANPRD